MIEKFTNPDNKDSIAQQVEAWKTGPTILASSSSFRQDRLIEAGFTDVNLADPIPDWVEANAAALLKEQGLAPTAYDSDGKNFGEIMASAKILYVLENQVVPGDALITAFDTVPVIYDTLTETQPMGSPTTQEKFPSFESARVGILEQLKTLANGTIELKNKLAEIEAFGIAENWSTEDIEVSKMSRLIGLRLGKIYILTSVAVCVPERRDLIGTHTQEVQLVSDTLFEVGENDDALEKLADLLIETQGDKTLKISGGINYADNHVRDILKLKEVTLTPDTASEDIYHGFSLDALTIALNQKARQVLNTSQTT